MGNAINRAKAIESLNSADTMIGRAIGDIATINQIIHDFSKNVCAEQGSELYNAYSQLLKITAEDHHNLSNEFNELHQALEEAINSSGLSQGAIVSRASNVKAQTRTSAGYVDGSSVVYEEPVVNADGAVGVIDQNRAEEDVTSLLTFSQNLSSDFMSAILCYQQIWRLARENYNTPVEDQAHICAEKVREEVANINSNLKTITDQLMKHIEKSLSSTNMAADALNEKITKISSRLSLSTITLN